MKRIKRTLRLLGLIILMILASVGIGIGGGAPIPQIKRRDDPIEIQDELVESTDDDKTEQFN